MTEISYDKLDREICEFIDFLDDCFTDYCLHDPSVGIYGPSDYQRELITEIMNNLKAKRNLLKLTGNSLT